MLLFRIERLEKEYLNLNCKIKLLADNLNSFAINCYRIMQNIKWQDKISNETLNKNTKQEPIVQTIQRRQLRFIGHCLRRDKEEFTYQYALYTPQPRHGKRK